MLALSKADLVTPEEAAAAAEAWRARFDGEVFVTSAATGQGTEELGLALLRTVPALEVPADLDLPEAEHMVFRPGGPGFTVERAGEGFRVSGPRVDRLIGRHDLENEEALAHVERTLHRMGVIRELEDLGFTPGDEVEIAGIAFDLDPSA